MHPNLVASVQPNLDAIQGKSLMTLADLIEAAIESKGSRKIVADGLSQDAQRLTDWKAGRRKPDAHEIAYLAECAGLPILETVAEIESQLDDRYAHIWREALGKMKAAGIAVSFAAMTVTGALSSHDANANPVSIGLQATSVYYVNLQSATENGCCAGAPVT
jgi:hypothetical protein